MSLGLIMWLA